MTTPPLDPRFSLHRVGHTQWHIQDAAAIGGDDRVIAQIYEVDEFEVVVVWTGPVELRAEYASPDDALDDLRRTTALHTRRAAERPVPIAHHQPIYRDNVFDEPTAAASH